MPNTVERVNVRETVKFTCIAVTIKLMTVCRYPHMQGIHIGKEQPGSVILITRFTWVTP